MRERTLRLYMAIFFAVMAVLLFSREWIAPGLDQKFPYLTLGSWFAPLMAGWNGARWYNAWSRQRESSIPTREPFRRDRDTAPPYECNPELDFFKQDSAKPEG